MAAALRAMAEASRTRITGSPSSFAISAVLPSSVVPLQAVLDQLHHSFHHGNVFVAEVLSKGLAVVSAR